MSEVYILFTSFFELAFATIPPRVLMIALPFLSAVAIIKVVKSL